MARRFELSSFEVFRDTSDSAFYESDGRSPQETWVEIISGMEGALAWGVELALARRQVTPEWIGEVHRLIFEGTFPADAGRFRGMLPNGAPEEVWFGISVSGSQTARIQPKKGVHPKRIVENLDRACLEFDNSAAEIRSGMVDPAVRTATTACAKLYAKIVNIHPFVDGNLRAAYVSLQASLLALELPLVQFDDLDRHDEAIDRALRVDGDQSYVPLASLIEEIIKSSA
jgi:fido (protein-threonine AMPylation protein)